MGAHDRDVWSSWLRFHRQRKGHNGPPARLGGRASVPGRGVEAGQLAFSEHSHIVPALGLGYDLPYAESRFPNRGMGRNAQRGLRVP